ncbi:MAG: ABC transporter ATP-binding protein [Candidatus Nealsonbacteria bacterium]|nr:ABC transporter ATP-binding protein [Candidatus Nealsonbacteria bacterium]
METQNADSSRLAEDFAIAVRGVSKSFRSQSGSGVYALDRLDLTVRKGEFVVLIGSTGCGKTTLLNILGGLEGQDRGDVRFAAGLNREDSVAYVFQHYTLFPWRTLLRNVTFGLEMRGVGRLQRNHKAKKLLRDVGLSDFENAYPHELSGGMRQRAAIAQALAREPKILLMDEPFGALDDATRKDLQQLLVGLWQDSGTTVLFVTHSIDEAVIMADRILVFSERPGRVIKDVTVDLPRPRDSLSSAFTDTFVEVRQAFYSRAG